MPAKTAPRKKRQRPAPEHLITTIPTPTRCRGCGAEVLAGHVWGERRRIDRVRLNLRAEAMALVLGGQTYQVGGYGKGLPLERRTNHIRDGLPEHGFIHAQHRCGVCWDHPQYRDERKPDADDGPCPF